MSDTNSKQPDQRPVDPHGLLERANKNFFRKLCVKEGIDPNSKVSPALLSLLRQQDEQRVAIDELGEK